jgi:hypothetical protein
MFTSKGLVRSSDPSWVPGVQKSRRPGTLHCNYSARNGVVIRVEDAGE